MPDELRQSVLSGDVGPRCSEDYDDDYDDSDYLYDEHYADEDEDEDEYYADED